MKKTRLTLAMGLALTAGAAQAAGPLFTTDGVEPQPYRWDTSNGPIPVWTDGGGAFTLRAVGDTNGDGKVDLVWESATSIRIQLMDGTSVTSTGFLGNGGGAFTLSLIHI